VHRVRRVHGVPMVVDRRQLSLGGAAVVVILIVGWSLWPSQPAPATGVPSTAAAQARTAKAGGSAGPVEPVKLGALTATREGPDNTARNPFRFQPKVVEPPPPPRVVQPPIVEGPRVPLPPPGPPPVPPIPLKLICVLERANGVKWAVLTDGRPGASPMYGKDGDIIDGRYAIVKIGTESIEMTYADGRGRQVIRLTGQ
jgi:hypothetical protein